MILFLSLSLIAFDAMKYYVDAQEKEESLDQDMRIHVGHAIDALEELVISYGREDALEDLLNLYLDIDTNIFCIHSEIWI